MKKSFVLMAVAAVVLSACAKENAYDATIVPQYTAEGNVLLFATMPQFEDATKAAIAADGTFSWAVGDKIDVVYTKGGSPNQTYIFSCTNASTGAFEYAGEIADGYTVDRAYYPSGYNGTPSNQHFASLEAAAKGFQMEATVSAGKLQFAHENAMFVVTVKNLPLFAKTVWVNSAAVDVTSEYGDVEVRIPVIPAASAKLNIGVTKVDAETPYDADNDIISKTSEKEAAIEAKNLYNLTDLEIVPEVHFVSGPTGWDPSDANRIDPVAGTYTKTRFAVLAGDEWCRFTVKYGSLVVPFGYSGGKDYDNGDPFVADNYGSAHITTDGLYSVSFNPITGAYTVTKTGDISLSLVGINSDADWAFSSVSNPALTKFGRIYVWRGITGNDKYKIYIPGETDDVWTENTLGAANIGWWEDNVARGSSAKNAGVVREEEAIIVLDLGIPTWRLYSERATTVESAKLSEVFIRGDFNGKDWSDGTQIEMTRNVTYPNIWMVENLEVEVGKAGQMKFLADGLWYGYGSSVEDIKASAQLSSDGSAQNINLPTGKYNIYFNSLFKSYSAIKIE